MFMVTLPIDALLIIENKKIPLTKISKNVKNVKIFIKFQINFKMLNFFFKNFIKF